MVSERKKRTLQELKGHMREYPVIGIINMHKLPGRQLQEIRDKLRGDALIRMVKKRLITRALEQSEVEGMRELAAHIRGEPAIILSRIDPFRLARKIELSKSRAPAKPGDTAPEDIMVKAGPTSLPPGPVIGELQKVKLPAGVQGDRIHIMRDTVLVRKGEEISRGMAGIMAKLGIEPMEIGLSLTAAWESGMIYPSGILFVPREEYERQVRDAVSSAFSLSVSIGHFTPETVPFFIAKAHSEATSLAANAEIITEDTLGRILAKASTQADTIAGMVKQAEQTAEQPAEEPAKDETKPEENKGRKDKDSPNKPDQDIRPVRE